MNIEVERKRHIRAYPLNHFYTLFNSFPCTNTFNNNFFHTQLMSVNNSYLHRFVFENIVDRCNVWVIKIKQTLPMEIVSAAPIKPSVTNVLYRHQMFPICRSTLREIKEVFGGMLCCFFHRRNNC